MIFTRAFALAGAVLVGCAASPEPKRNADPPSGVVDPGNVRLASASGGDFAPPSAAPSEGAPGQKPGGDVVPPLPSLGGSLGGLGAVDTPPPTPSPAPPKGAPATGRATEEIVMTREHCETLGRKFADLAMNEGGGEQARPQAEKMGRDFAAGCNRNMVGQTVRKAEYDCMIRAKASTQLISCKR